MTTTVEPVAIIGLACRLPQADGPAAFWQLLREGRDAITEASERRWPAAVVGNHRRGGFLDQVDGFDAGFFGISPKEAAAMDPQQRLVLELAWEALEQARIVPAGLRDSAAGVFIGSISNEYPALTGATGPHGYPGGHRAIIANRVSYFLGLRGPSLTVDCGQSSSLVAVQLACESLRRGESRIALAGGVNLNLLAETTAAIGRFGALSPDGRCHVFDERANGYVRGEGAGLVLLKPLAAALADGDPVHCVILGGALNNDGGGQTLTSPTEQAQRAVITAACAQAGVHPSELQYVELHGTGTPVGDPIEAAALGAVVGAERPYDQPVLVGSVKTNIGHLEGAAGIAGLLKLVLSLSHRELTPTLHFDRPNPAIPLTELGLRLVTGNQPWPDDRRRLIGGVSSFGMGGTNCHLVLAELPVTEVPEPATVELPWLISAKSPTALRAQADRLHSLVESGAPSSAALALSLSRSRTVFGHRAVVPAGSLAGLRNLADGVLDPGVVTGTAAGSGDSVLVFPGQGSQWPAMARELLASNPEFTDRLTACATALDEFVDYSLLDVLRGVPGAADFDRVDVVQPALWAMMTALAGLWQDRGVRPAAVIGHSQGEIAAATAIGALSLTDGARVVALRSRAIAAVAGAGGMLSVAGPVDEVLAAVHEHAPRSGIAAVNGPRSTVVSGPSPELAELQLQLTVAGYRTKLLPVDYASHSAEMEQLRGEVLANLAGVRPVSVPVTFLSTLVGEPIDTAELTADYWYRSLRNPVRFADATRAALAAGHRLFVECSPHPVLVGAIGELAEELELDALALGTLRRDEGGPARWDRALAEAWVAGAPVRWEEAGPVPGSALLELPTYPFQRVRHWGGVVEQPSEAKPLAPATSRAELRNLVLTLTAGVLGHADPSAITADQNFKDLGVDSTAAVELRTRLREATGLPLPSSLVFDHPSPAQLTDRLHQLSTAPDRPVVVDQACTDEDSADLDDPIVIVAMGCRYPGGIDSPEELWRLVARGGDATGDFPTDRGWDLAALFDDGPDRTGTSDTRRGGFLAHADRFDAGLFGISPREAQAMDPQQRVLLEICWQALERAGLDPQGLRGSRTGVFIGAMAPDYGPRLHQPAGSADGHLLTGTALSVVSGRVAYTFGLEGPAVTVDTACSSSLVAIHQAVQALRRGECTLALAGGVTVMSTPGMFVEFSRQGGLSADGRCKAFGAEADGTGWAEGAGVLLLERRSQAERHGRPVLAVIRGSAVNQDGRSNGLTAPNGSAQQRVIRQALADARLAASEVDLVEAHGTGTALGDPIEAEALLATYGADRTADRPLWLGSVKSNLGHTQAAAGVAGVIKSVLALRHGTFPATLHADQPSPLVDWASGGVRLLTEPVAAPLDRPVRAAVSGFGISGTNGHLILESGPTASAGSDELSGVLVWTFSARSVEALHDYAGRLRDWAAGASDGELAATGASLARRTVLGHRAVLIAADRAELLAALAALADGVRHPAVVVGTAAELAPVFVFPGQGTQWAGMAYELLERSDVFWDWICRCDGALAAHVDWSVLDVLRQEDGAPALAGSDVIQPVLFAVMVALAELWRSLGVEPTTVLGHSQGEITAACVAGAISLEDAARIVVLRSRALMRLTGTGGMLTVPLPLDRVQPLLADWPDRLWPAILSGPDSTVIAGDLDAISEFVTAHGSTGQLRRVAIDYAAHTPHIEALQQELAEILAGLQPCPTEVTVCSSLTGEFIAATELVADYWYRGLRHPVRFADAVRTAAGAGRSLFLEVSPHPVLAGQIGDILRAADQPGQAIGSLRRDSGWQRMLTSFAEAWVAGAPLDWTRLLGRPNRQLELPGYPFEHRRYWLESPAGVLPGTAAMSHPLLAAVVELADGGWLMTGRLSRAGLPWLSDHAVADEVLLPGTALLELALQAGTVAGCGQVEDLTLIRPVVLPAPGSVRLQLAIGSPDDDGRCALAVHARATDHEPWLQHATGMLAPAADPVGASMDWSPDGASLDLTDCYSELAERGYRYGPAFQGLHQAWQAAGECYAEVALPESAGPAEDYLIHPALLDAALHAVLLAGGSSELLLPFNWSTVVVHRAAGNRLRVRFTELSDDLVELVAQDVAGNLVATGTLTLRRAGAAESIAARPQQIDWVPAEATELALAGQRWAAIGASADELVAELAEAGVSAASHYDLVSLAELGAVPPVVLAPIELPSDAADDVPGAIREILAELLDLIQGWLGDERCAGSRLTVLSPGSGAGTSEELSAVLGGAVWGLVRSAATEHPGRFALLDGNRPNWAQAAAAVAAGDWQLAVRDGQLLVPRVATLPAPTADPLELSDGTVLVTGGTSGLGALAAERLVEVHGVRSLLLLSRRGPATPGADELVDRLRGLGAEVTVLACDVANRRALTTALAQAPRLVGVVHAAGVLDDAPVDRLSAVQLEPVLAAKADAAWHLHELTAGHELAFFLEYSSVAGIIGTAGQGNYAAANGFLDGLAGYRNSQGLSATAIDWGLWQQATGVTGRLTEQDRARLAQAGLAGLGTDAGLALLDQAIASSEPVLLAANWDRPALQARSDSGTLPPMLKPLVKVSKASTTRPSERGEQRQQESTLATRLVALNQSAARQLLVNLVQEQVAVVLGHADPHAIELSQGFNDLGFDSLTVVDLRNRLDQATGLRLPASLAFDHPTPAALADHLLTTLAPAPPAPEESLRIALDDVQQQLSADGSDRTKVIALLQRTLARLESGGVSAGLHETISTATDDEIFALIDNQFSS